MYLWRKSATPRWLSDNESRLRTRAGDQLAAIERADRKRLQLGSQFDASTGAVKSGPAEEPVRTYRVEEVGGRVRLVVPAE